MELGGNIELHGFIEEEEQDLIIIKKIVGRFTKQLSQELDTFRGLAVIFAQEEDTVHVDVRLELSGADVQAQTSANNLYLALDTALKELQLRAQEHE